MPSSSLSNQLHRARRILEALQHGIDPIANSELPSDSIVNNIEVNRAIGLGVLALDQMNARMQRRAQLPSNVGKAWTKEEEKSLVVAFEGGKTAKDIAVRLGRTDRAIESRLQKLGLLLEGERTTGASFDRMTEGGSENE